MKVRRNTGTLAVLAVITIILASACGSTSQGAASKKTGGDFIFAAEGGSNVNALMAACVDPFAKMHGLTPETVPLTPAQFTLQEKEHPNSIPWNIVFNQVDQPGAGNWAAELAPINYSIVNDPDIPAKYKTTYGIAHDIYADVILYNTKKFGADPPQNWSDVFNTSKYPGKRSMASINFDGPTDISTIYQIAGSGVFPPANPDPSVVAKALGEIRGDATFWDSSSQSEEVFQTGEADIGMIISSHVSDLVKAGVPVAVQWNQALILPEWLEVAKNAPDITLDMQFIEYCLSTGPQMKYTELHPNAPVNTAAAAALPLSISSQLPTSPAHEKKTYLISTSFWTPGETAKFTSLLEGLELGG